MGNLSVIEPLPEKQRADLELASVCKVLPVTKNHIKPGPGTIRLSVRCEENIQGRHDYNNHSVALNNALH